MEIFSDDCRALRISDRSGQPRRRSTCRQRGGISEEVLDAAYPVVVPSLGFTSSSGTGFSPGPIQVQVLYR